MQVCKLIKIVHFMTVSLINSIFSKFKLIINYKLTLDALACETGCMGAWLAVSPGQKQAGKNQLGNVKNKCICWWILLAAKTWWLGIFDQPFWPCSSPSASSIMDVNMQVGSKGLCHNSVQVFMTKSPIVWHCMAETKFRTNNIELWILNGFAKFSKSFWLIQNITFLFKMHIHWIFSKILSHGFYKDNYMQNTTWTNYSFLRLFAFWNDNVKLI